MRRTALALLLLAAPLPALAQSIPVGGSCPQGLSTSDWSSLPNREGEYQSSLTLRNATRSIVSLTVTPVGAGALPSVVVELGPLGSRRVMVFRTPQRMGPTAIREGTRIACN